jgi:hypothetical protein
VSYSFALISYRFVSDRIGSYRIVLRQVSFRLVSYGLVSYRVVSFRSCCRLAVFVRACSVSQRAGGVLTGGVAKVTFRSRVCSARAPPPSRFVSYPAEEGEKGVIRSAPRSSSAMIAQGKWRQVWRMALARAANLQAKREQNPSTAR